MTLVLSRSDVHALLTLPDCIAAVEQAFPSTRTARRSAPACSACPCPAAAFT